MTTIGLTIYPGLVGTPCVRVLLKESTRKLQCENLTSRRLEERGFHEFLEERTCRRLCRWFNLRISSCLEIGRWYHIWRSVASRFTRGRYIQVPLKVVTIYPNTGLERAHSLHCKCFITQSEQPSAVKSIVNWSLACLSGKGYMVWMVTHQLLDYSMRSKNIGVPQGRPYLSSRCVFGRRNP